VASREGDVGAGLVANFHALRCHPPIAPHDPDIVVVKHGVILKGVALKECRELRRECFQQSTWQRLGEQLQWPGQP